MDPSRSVERRLMLSFAVFGVFWGAWGALLPAIKNNVDATEAQLGMALLFIALGAILGMLAAGRLFDRLGTRVLTPAHVFFALATIPPVLVSGTIQLVPTLLLLGVGTGVLDVVINGAASTYETQSGKPLMGGVHAMFSLGVLVAGVSVGAARDAGVSDLAILMPIVTLILVGAAATRNLGLMVDRRPPGHAPRITRLVLIFGVLCGLAFLIEDGMLSWSAIHLEQTLGGSPIIGGLGPTCLAAAMVLGRASTSRLSERYDTRALLGAGGIVGAVGAAIVAVAPSELVALVGIMIAGAGISVCAPLIFSLTGRLAEPGRQGSAISQVTTIAYTGFIIGPALVGGVAGIAGLRVGIGAMVVVALLLAAGARWVPAETRSAGV